MSRVITPRGRGFLFFDAHPAGCRRMVRELWHQVAPLERPSDRRPTVLIIGSSAGYGLATTIAGLARHGVRGIGVCAEKPPSRRTATAGWYRTAELAHLAEEAGTDMSWINADAFADATKKQVTDLLADAYGPVDYVVYSLAAPKRPDPDTGAVHHSVIKAVGAPHTTKTLEFDDAGAGVVRSTTVPAATDEEIADTVAVMGGADWRRWITALNDAELLAPGCTTLALTYIGSPLTAPIYRSGTIGHAKADLEATAHRLNTLLAEHGGTACTSVNGAAVTQSSAAIPGIGLYLAALRAELGTSMQSPIAQSVRLWDHITGTTPAPVDDEGRLRLDDWELTDAVQAAVTRRWERTTPDSAAEQIDIDWFRREVRGLYGFDVDGVDYTAATEPDIAWPTPRGAP